MMYADSLMIDDMKRSASGRKSLSPGLQQRSKIQNYLSNNILLEQSPMPSSNPMAAMMS